MVNLKPLTAASFAALMLAGFASTADAAEGGAGVYLLGKRGPLAAFVPKPGWYLTNDVFFLTADRSELTPLGDRIVGNVDAEALINIAQFTWVADTTVLGGRLAFTGVLPYGNVDVTAGRIVEGPGGIETRPHHRRLGHRCRRPGAGQLARLEEAHRRQVPGLERVRVGVHPGRRL
jgi:hypothetical protein